MNEALQTKSSIAWVDAIARIAQDVQPRLVTLRRILHANPELSMHEFETTRRLAEEVRGLGLSAKVTDRNTGLTCDWVSSRTDRPTQTIGLRGDIDALPIATTVRHAYASARDGVMHACGHDAHATMVWGAVAILQRLDEQTLLPWAVAVRAIFQPAEETSEGGPLMVQFGALDGVACVLALHVDPMQPVGTVAGRPGPFTAACDSFDIEITGRAGHSARPHLSIDAIASAASWIGEMYARVPRVHDCRDPAVVSVGTIQAGTASNIVAGSAHMSGTIRTFSESARAAIMQEMRNVAEATEKTFGCRVCVVFSAYTPSLHNDPSLNATMQHMAGRLPSIEQVVQIDLPSMGAEDFAFFAQHKPVCMMRLGIAGPTCGSHALHTASFDIDERALAIGAQLLAATAIELSNPNIQQSKTHESPAQ